MIEEEGGESESGIDSILLLLDSDTIARTKNVASASRATSTTSYTVAAVSAISAGSATSSFGLVMMSKFILYLRYLKVNYSPKMILYFYHYGTSSFSLGLAMPESWVEDFDQETIPIILDFMKSIQAI